MSVMRVNKNKNYTNMSNVHLRDKTLSLKAKGLLSVVLTLPDDWKYSIGGLVSICKESETSVKSALDELKEHKYLTVTKISPNKDNKGRYEYVYDFFEKPIQEGEKQGVEILPLENQPLEILGVENHPLYKTTDESTTDKSITDIPTTDNGNSKRTKFVKPTIEELQAYIFENGYSIDAERFYDYYEANGWYTGNRKMKDWKATVRNWERRENERANNHYSKPNNNGYSNPFSDPNL